jgi:hypothetical protein
MEGKNLYSIMSNDKEALKASAKYLADFGHKTVAWKHEN